MTGMEGATGLGLIALILGFASGGVISCAEEPRLERLGWLMLGAAVIFVLPLICRLLIAAVLQA